jgi:GrpB-like predicted nucleotidyltransferase (UPF0157 family)
MAVDCIRIVEYEPAWPSQYRAEAAIIGAILGGLALRVDHVGSTAVPGLAAKPVIDIQVSVASLQPRGAFDDLLARIGYTHVDVGEFDAVYPFYQRPDDWPTTHHLHLCRVGSAEELNHLVFRDYLRDHPTTAREYEALKRALAASQSGTTLADRKRYSDAKTPFIADVVSRALAQGYAVPSPPSADG